MSTFESSIKQIPYKQESVYNMLSDLSNLERIKDKLPEDKIKDLQFDSDSISISSPMGAVKMRIINREAPKEIKFEAEDSPLPFNFWIQMLPVTESSSKLKLTLKADLNPFIKGMVKKPLQEAIEKIADVMAIIPYE